MKKNRQNILFYLVAGLSLLGSIECRKTTPVKKYPAHDSGTPSEFHREPHKYIPTVFGSYNRRGIENSEDRDFMKNSGFGAGVFINQEMSSQWTGHKLLYYYFDVEASREAKNEPDYPGATVWNVSSYPGLYLRHWFPFMKIFYGFGLNFRYIPSTHDFWGIYGQAGVQFSGLTFSALMITHPGQTHIDMEYRLGWLF